MIVGDIFISPQAADYTDSDGSVMLLCDGRVLVPGTYPVLEALVGAAFGAAGQIPQFTADGVATGRIPIGASPAGGYALGAKAGVEAHIHHCAGFVLNHIYFGGVVNTDPGGGPPPTPNGGVTDAAAPGHTHSLPSLVPAKHGIQPDVDNQSLMPPMLAMAFFIKAA
jgi:hypothetical protein